MNATVARHEYVAGVDEAGRGPLAGPVVAAAVILDAGNVIEGLMDSKKLTPKKRERLAEVIRCRAISVGIGEASTHEIDDLNILQASLLAMRRAIAALRVKPSRVLVDGNQFPMIEYPVETVIHGDSLIPSISAASIIAKTWRDNIMMKLHERYPHYGFASNKGYPTTAHIDAIALHGVCPAHRRSFEPVRKVLNGSV